MLSFDLFASIPHISPAKGANAIFVAHSARFSISCCVFVLLAVCGIRLSIIFQAPGAIGYNAVFKILAGFSTNHLTHCQIASAPALNQSQIASLAHFMVLPILVVSNWLQVLSTCCCAFGACSGYNGFACAGVGLILYCGCAVGGAATIGVAGAAAIGTGAGGFST